jgi:hypothetical protein
MKKLTKQHERRRAGLAPLELTLSLPIMLFVMGLMIIAGTTGAWKARTVTNARQSVWRTLHPRQGSEDGNPLGWPSSARMHVEDGQDSLIAFDPYEYHTVVRGQPLTAPSGETMEVEQGLFDMQEGLRLGHAAIERRYPVMGNMPPGRIDIRRDHAILDENWTFQNMGLSSNRIRRINHIYPQDREAQLMQQAIRYQNAAVVILSNPNNPILDILDNDQELGSPMPGGMMYEPAYGIGYSPDYHLPNDRDLFRRLTDPRRICSYNPQTIRDNLVIDLLNAINQVPRRLTNDHLRMYNAHVQHIDRLLQALDGGQLPDRTRAYLQTKRPQMQQNKGQLEQYIRQLEQFGG